MARKQIVSKSWTKAELNGMLTSHEVTFTALKDGTKIKTGTKRVFDLNKVPENNQLNLKLHGAAQKIGDDYSGVKGDVDLAFEKIDSMIEQIYSGAWKGERESEGIRLDDLAEAIADVRKLPLEKVLDALAAPVLEAENGEEPTEEAVKEYEAEMAAYEAKIAELRKHPAVQLYMNKKRQARLEQEVAERAAAEAAAGRQDALAAIGA